MHGQSRVKLNLVIANTEQDEKHWALNIAANRATENGVNSNRLQTCCQINRSMSFDETTFFAALTSLGLPEVPKQFSVVPLAQLIRRETLLEINNFIGLFDRVTTRVSWQKAATRSAPQIAQSSRSEICFFTAWDFHISPEQGWQLIECNDNGSGFLFAAAINHLYYKLSDLAQASAIEAPPGVDAFGEQLAAMIEREAKDFFGAVPDGLFLILETTGMLRVGKFYQELILLRDLLRRRGWHSEIGSPDQLRWDGRDLFWNGRRVDFIINRCTDFFWDGDECSSLRAGYLNGRVYVAPNPFTYATRSDKRLFEWLSSSHSDRELGILPEERALLSAHVPETFLLQDENLSELAAKKTEFFFKPTHGFASHGILTSSQVGTARLRQLLKRNRPYVAQKSVAKPTLKVTRPGSDVTLWTDLRVWAYRGECFLLSGRASTQRDRIDLTPPGGWLPTFVL